jgi:hypothetical protein
VDTCQLGYVLERNKKYSIGSDGTWTAESIRSFSCRLSNVVGSKFVDTDC